jgi:putative FmdB family regulatory protein
MPLFDFQCLNPNCKHEFQEAIELGSKKNPKCPKCQKKKTKKIFTGAPKITGLSKKS